MTTASTRKYDNACRLMELLEEHGFETRLVGGCVRDRYLNLQAHDYDLATTAIPQEVTAVCKAARMKVIPTGLEHGTVTVVIQSHSFEVTTLRQDISTDGRHATVQFGSSFHEDAARRDFTMNAMSEDRSGKVYDYFGGIKHLQEKLIVFVGDPATRIQEDYLRILRFFRFKARFALTSEDHTLQAITAHKHGLAAISQERITSELWGLFACTSIGPAFHELITTSVFAEIFPELTGVIADPRAPLTEVQAALDVLAVEHRPLGRFAACLLLGYGSSYPAAAAPNVGTMGESSALSLVDRLKLSRRDRSSLVMAHEGLGLLGDLGSDQASLFEFIDRCEAAGGEGIFTELYHPLWAIVVDKKHPEQAASVRLKLAELMKAETTAGHIRRQVLPVTGKDLMAWTGWDAGPKLGQLLSFLKRAFRNGEWRDVSEAQALIASYVANLDPVDRGGAH